MTKQLVLVSHGHFCEELKKSTEMIMGPLEFVHTVPLLPEEGIDDFTAKFLATVKKLDLRDGVDRHDARGHGRASREPHERSGQEGGDQSAWYESDYADFNSCQKLSGL